MMDLVNLLLIGFGIYLGLGLIFALFFVTKGVGKIDPTAKAGTISFRLLIIPGTMAFWPLLAKRWWQGMNEPPEEKNPHRVAACMYHAQRGDGGKK
ncbi:hypothetical protein L0337_35925 [candidate division KSB1 bacterium]|nr:hypothetical protein [candidate division KSB1 bacterium]